MRSTLVWAVLSLFLLLPFASYAWGQNGHRVIGAIAQKNLSNRAERKITDLLDGHSLAWVSTYMDEIKSDDSFDFARDWHWVTIPEGKTYSETDKNPNGDLIEAIGRMKTVVAHKDTTKEARVQALKFLVHLVGDLHQPLHIGNGQDRGGNDLKVKWFGKSSNLHRVWDSEMLRTRDYAYSELARELQQTVSDQCRRKWTKGSVLDWAHESLEYREAIYSIDNPDYMGYEYTYQHWGRLTRQLQKGGVRLATILNDLF